VPAGAVLIEPAAFGEGLGLMWLQQQVSEFRSSGTILRYQETSNP
jgi:hypothetical protein